MKKNILCAVLFSAQTIYTHAQTADSTITRPGQVTFFYPIGTNGIDAPKYQNNVSLNALYGISGGVNGFELAGLVNTSLGDVYGAQIAGIANIDTKKTSGLIAAGIANVLSDSSSSLCLAGIANVFGKSATGMHAAGISNTVNGNYLGLQFSGISNMVAGTTLGGQFAGISNISTGEFKGFQAAGISNLVYGDLTGAQIGFINTAKKIKGFQFGFINIAEEFEQGVPLGFLSFVKNGYHAFELSATESVYANATLKVGVEKLYNIFKVGYTANGAENYMTYGVGLGSMVSLTEKARLSFDLSGNQIIGSFLNPKLDILSKADVAFRYRFNKHFGVFAGPSFNGYVAEHDVDTENTSLPVPYALYRHNWGNKEGSTSLWVGANAGLSILF